VLSDLDIGMNDWMCPEFKWDESYQPDRGKVLDAEQIQKIEKFWRYYDHDNDGIPQRTLPGINPKAAYFARGSGHNQYGGYTEDSKEYQIVVDRLRKKWITAGHLVPKAIIERNEKIDIAIVACGSSDGAVREARARLAAQGIQTNYMRIRGFPFGDEVEAFLQAHKVNFVVEQNRDAQLRSLLILETGIEKTRLRSILHYNGMPIPARYVTDGVAAMITPNRPAAQLVS